MALNSIRNNYLVIPHVNHDYSGTKSLKFQCPSTWNEFMKNIASKKIMLSTAPNSYLDFNKILNIYQLKRKLKTHFLYLYASE